MLTTEPPPITQDQPASVTKAPAATPVRIEHGPTRWDQIGERPEAGEEEIPLEPWLEDRIAAHADLTRQRAVRGGTWYLGAMHRWDVRNTHELLTKVAPELVTSYRGDPPGHPPGHEEAYYDRQLAWLEQTLQRLMQPPDAPQPTTRLVALYREGEQLRARLLLSGSSIFGDLVRGTANQRQVERERFARDWDGRVVDVLADDARPLWIAAATLPEHKLDPASTIAGVRAFLATKLVCLKEIISQLEDGQPNADSTASARSQAVSPESIEREP